MLNVVEIFASIEGETTHAGRPCVFIRLAGCNLSCAWCDTRYAANSSDGQPMAVAATVERAARYGLPLACVTGGEPLLQVETPALCAALAGQGMEVLVETNGSLDISPIKYPAKRMMDLKPPSSGEAERIDWGNLERLRVGDEIKVVIAGRGDYDWLRSVLASRKIPQAVPVILSPAASAQSPAELASWIVADKLPARMQLQLHKIIWPKIERGV